MHTNVITVYRRVPYSEYNLGYLEYDPVLRESRRYRTDRSPLEETPSHWDEGQFDSWLREYALSWSLDVEDAWFAADWLDVGL